MANVKKVINNETVKEFFKLPAFQDIWDIESFYMNVPQSIEDILRGATGQLSGTQRSSSYRVFRMLSTLNEISTETVSEMLNRKQIALTGKPYGREYIRQWVSVLTCANQALTHHILTKGNIIGSNQEVLNNKTKAEKPKLDVTKLSRPLAPELYESLKQRGLIKE